MKFNIVSSLRAGGGSRRRWRRSKNMIEINDLGVWRAAA
jgi:hypothetical protein